MSLKDAAVAVNRFGLGPRPGEIDKVAGNPRRWLLEQLEGKAETPRQLKGFPGTLDHLRNYSYRYRELGVRVNQAQAAAKQKGDQAAIDKGAKDGERMLTGYVGWVNELLGIEWAARTNVALTTDQPFRERLMRFWSNHLVVPAIKQQSTIHVGAYEREAIRPFVAGKFADMLMASAKNAGMLMFLDNNISIGPNSPAAKKTGRALNENLGREILELHTLGVEGGYGQDDVIELALGISGWSTAEYLPSSLGRAFTPLPKATGPFGFGYYEDWHEPGARTLLGKSYAAKGLSQGEEMLNDLARHPNTARFLASKLARHFVEDEPSKDLVQRMADAYLAKDTDLAEMTRVLIEAEEPWRLALSKVKQPEDFIVSALRALGLTIASDKVPVPKLYDFEKYSRYQMMWQGSGADASIFVGALERSAQATAGGEGMEGGMEGMDGKAGGMAERPRAPFVRAALELTALYQAIAAMGQRPMGAPGPQGWYDRASDWAGADSILKRIEWVFTAAEAHEGRVADARTFLASTLGELANESLAFEVAGAATKAQGIGLVLGSPEFQRR